MSLEEIQIRHRHLRDQLEALEPGLSGALLAAADEGCRPKGGTSVRGNGEAVH